MSRARNTYRRRCNTSLDQENEDIERLFDLHGAQENQGAVFANKNIIDNKYLHEEEKDEPDKVNSSIDDDVDDVDSVGVDGVDSVDVEESEDESEPKDDASSSVLLSCSSVSSASEQLLASVTTLLASERRYSLCWRCGIWRRNLVGGGTSWRNHNVVVRGSEDELR